MNPEFAITLRAKKLGILLKDARLTAGKTMKECGESLGISGSTVGSYEKGDSSPSLPELEILSYLFKVPMDRFWKDKLLSLEEDLADKFDLEAFIESRHVQIGERLRIAREEQGKTYEHITEETGVTYGRMKRFEAGETPIPLPELELLSNALGISFPEFHEQDSHVGRWISAQSSMIEFLSMPAEMQQFITKPVNQPYLEIALNLSKLSADQLRAIAESLLEITI